MCALRTNRAYQALSDEGFDHRREQKRLHIHVEQTRDAAHSIVGVQRTENEVTGHRCANRDVGGFDVANLTHHHHVRILPQNVAKTFGERQINLRLHVNLRHTGNAIFNRFFDSDDAPLHRIDAAEEAIQRS